MELLTLDANFQPVDYLQHINLQWNREYYQAGNFSVQIPANQYNPQMRYLYTPNRPETGIIQKVELTETVKGQFIQLSGFFLEAILNDKIVYPTYYAKGPLDTAVCSMVTKYKADIPLLQVAAAPGNAPSVVWQETGGQLGNAAYTRLQTQQRSYRCSYDYQSNVITFSVWQGLNRTQEQSENNFVVFSNGFKNLDNLRASMDSSNYKNYAVVAGQGEAENRKVAYADLSNGGYHKILFVDARNEAWNTEEQTESEYLQSLAQKGHDQLLNYQNEQNIEVDVTQGAFRYLTDFDLGDLVDVAIDTLGVHMQASIVSAHEVEKSNCHTVTIELGNKMLTSLQKARLIY